MSRWLPYVPTAASTSAGDVDALFLFMVVASSIITLGIFLCLIVFTIRFRRRPGNEVARQTPGNLKLEATWR